MRTRRHALGQNFLHHKPTIEKISALVSTELHASAQKPRSLLEIGPGKLALTHPLTAIARDLQLPLMLVERDRYLEAEIRHELAESQTAPDLCFMDAATEKFLDLFDELERNGRAPVFVASNLPYSASSQILARLCHRSRLISGCVVMVQKELAQRMVAPPASSERGAFSLLIQSYFTVEAAFDVGPGAFTPAPKVTSTVLAMRPLETPWTSGLKSPEGFEKFCKALFSQRRKMIRKLVPQEKHQLFPKLGISGTERPEALDLQIILKLYQGISE